MINDISKQVTIVSSRIRGLQLQRSAVQQQIIKVIHSGEENSKKQEKLKELEKQMQRIEWGITKLEREAILEKKKPNDTPKEQPRVVSVDPDKGTNVDYLL